ncbi:MAG: hypothetical protein SGARI_003701 [Bacillariaceae sp.]
MPSGKKSSSSSDDAAIESAADDAAIESAAGNAPTGKKGTGAAIADADMFADDIVCEICPPGSCYQAPTDPYPKDDEQIVYEGATGAGISVNSGVQVPDVTCGAIEILAKIPGAMRGRYCRKLKVDAMSGICGGCGTVNCIL